MHQLGPTLRRARLSLHLSQKELGDRVKLNDSVISRIECGIVDELLTTLDNALSDQVQESLRAGHLDAPASEALAAVQALQPVPLAVAA